MMRVVAFTPAFLALLFLPGGAAYTSTRGSYNNPNNMPQHHHNPSQGAPQSKSQTLAAYQAYMASSQTTTTQATSVESTEPAPETPSDTESTPESTGTGPSSEATTGTDPTPTDPTPTDPTGDTEPELPEEVLKCQEMIEDMQELGNCVETLKASEKSNAGLFCHVKAQETSLAEWSPVSQVGCVAHGQFLNPNGGRRRRDRRLRQIHGLGDGKKKFRGAVFQEEEDLAKSFMHKFVVVQIEYHEDCLCYAKMDSEGFTSMCPKSDVCQQLLSSVAI